MISKKDITKVVKNVVRRDRGVPDRRLMHPRREWSVGLLLWITVVLAGGFYAAVTFNTYTGINVDDEVVEVNQLRYKRAEALDAIEIYEKKKASHDLLLQSRPIEASTPEAEVGAEPGVVEDEVGSEPNPEPEAETAPTTVN